MPNKRVVVLHTSYGCDTGCCGHVVEVDGEQVGRFEFEHPYGVNEREWTVELARRTLEKAGCLFNESDLDWENCKVTDD